VCLLSDKPVSDLEPDPVEHWLFKLAELPSRLLGLLTHTPGIRLLFEEAPGVAVEYGYSHPLELGACPVFRADGLSLFLGTAAHGPVVEPMVVEKLPALWDVRALLRPGFDALTVETLTPSAAVELGRVSVDVAVVPAGSRLERPIANQLAESDFALLRSLAYLLGRRALEAIRVQMTNAGLFLIGEADVDPLPLGDLYSSPHPRLFVPVGWEITPRVRPGLVVELLGRAPNTIYFVGRDNRVLGLDPAKFVSLAEALLQPGVWLPAEAQGFAEELSLELPTLSLDSLPFRPLRSARGFDEE
jgi:hypothetical protein